MKKKEHEKGGYEKKSLGYGKKKGRETEEGIEKGSRRREKTKEKEGEETQMKKKKGPREREKGGEETERGRRAGFIQGYEQTRSSDLTRSAY